jgi:hypothetical protein
MNMYAALGSGVGTNEGSSLGARLSAWHDAMVTHARRLRAGRTANSCDDECPHGEARALWSEALETFGVRAHELTFLRACASEPLRRSNGSASRETRSEARETAASSKHACSGSGGHPRVAAEL